MVRFRSVLFALALIPAPALADPSCFGLCSIDCVKPMTIPDRWDDFSVTGSVGWSGNGQWDSEKFTDTNGNGLYDPGEAFVDGSSAYTTSGHGPVDGQYNAEYYDPLNTGYVASKDVGLEVVLAAGIPLGTAFVTRYYATDLAVPSWVATAADRFRWNWANCNPTMISLGDRLVTEGGNLKGPTAQATRDIIDQDPSAYWDDGCQCVNSAMGDESPRLFVLTAQDPRIPLAAGSQSILVSKLIGFFIESSDANANLRGRLIQIHRTGAKACPNGGGFVVDCAVPALTRTWGGIKATYR